MSDPIVAPAAPSGQSQAPVQPSPGTAVTTPFFEYEWEEGNKAGKNGKEVFKTKEELSKAYREGVLRHADYTQKTQGLAKEKEAVQKRDKELAAMAEELVRRKGEIDPLSQFLDSRPDIKDYIVKNMRQPSQSANAEVIKKMIEEQTKPLQEKLSEAEKFRKDQEQAVKREQIFSHLGTQYKDFNREAIEKRLKELDEVPEGEEDRSFLEMLYWAEKGRNPTASPVEIEKKITDSLAVKKLKQSPVPQARSVNVGPDNLPASVTGSRDPIRAAAEHYKRNHTE